MNVPIGHDDRSELQTHAEVLKRDRNRRKPRPWLNDRKWELTSSEKAGFLAIHGNQIRFGENLQQIFALQGFDGSAKINVRTKEKKVQDIVDSSCGRGGGGRRSARSSLRSGSERLGPEAPELSGRDRSYRISRSGRNEVHPELSEGSTVHFRELYLQQNFLRAHRTEGEY